MKINLALIAFLIMVMIAAAGFADTTLTTIYPQKSLTVGDAAPATQNTVEVVDGSVNVAGMDMPVDTTKAACYKIGNTRALASFGTDNWFIGNAGNSTVNGSDNICMGNSAGQSLSSSGQNVLIGPSAGQYLTSTGNGNIYIGLNAGKGTGAYSSWGNVCIGTGTGKQFTNFPSGFGMNTFIGNGAGYSESTGSNNVFIGYDAAYEETGSYKLYIQSCTGGVSQGFVPLIYGTFYNAALGYTNQLAINSTTTGGHTLYVAGDILATGAITSNSDIRLKKNIETLSNPIDKISRLRGVKFNWRREEFKDKNFSAGRQIGIIAQEIEKEFPELVSTGTDGYKGVDYGKLSAVLLEAVKAQQKEIAGQNAKIDKLENELKLLQPNNVKNLH